MHIEDQPGLEAEDSLQTGLAPNEPTGLDLEPSDDSIRELKQKQGRQTSTHNKYVQVHQ